MPYAALSGFITHRMLHKLRGPIDRIALPVGGILGRIGISPNVITVFGTVIIATGCLLIIQGERVIGSLVLIGGSLFDLIDGAIAKASKVQTKMGAFLDSTTDRLSDGLLFAAIVWIQVDSRLGLALALAAMVLGFMVSYIRARAESLGFTCEVGIAERAERVTLIVVGLIFNILIPMLVLLVALLVVTVIQRFVHVYLQARRAT